MHVAFIRKATLRLHSLCVAFGSSLKRPSRSFPVQHAWGSFKPFTALMFQYFTSRVFTLLRSLGFVYSR